MASDAAEIKLGIDASDAKKKLAETGKSLEKLGATGSKAGKKLAKGLGSELSEEDKKLAGILALAKVKIKEKEKELKKQEAEAKKSGGNIGKKLVEGFKNSFVGGAIINIGKALGIDHFLDDMKNKVKEMVNITDKIYGRVDKAKAYRESIRDLTGEMERNNEIARINPGLTMEMIEKNRDLQIAIDNVNFAYRDLSEEDKKREERLSELQARWTAVNETITDVSMTIMDGLLPVFDWVVSAVEKNLVPAMAALSTIWTNGWDVIQLAVISAELSCVKVFNNLKYYFTDYLPAAMQWFAENWKNIFSDLGYNLMQFCTNVGKNIKALWNAIKNYIKTGNWDFVGTALTEGMISTVKEFKAPERKKTEQEDILEKLLNETSEKVAKGYTNNYNWTAEKLDRNKKKAEEDRTGKNAPVGKAEQEKLMMSSPKASTSDLVGAYMNIQTSVANRFQERLVNRQIEAANRNADRQIAAIDRVAAKLDGAAPVAVVAQG